MEKLTYVQFIENTFYDYYSDLGYEILPEQPAYPSPDKSVLFIGAQINTWKPRLYTQNKYSENVANPQTCVRTQNLEYYRDPNVDFDFCTVFRTHGVLTENDLETSINESYIYLTEMLKISKDRLFIKSSEDQAKRLGIDCEIEIDSEPETYYKWKYGSPELTGTGITYAIKQANGNNKDIGNVIEIKVDNKIAAIEWGFGEEVLAQAISGGIHPLSHSRFLPDSIINKLDSLHSVKLIDAGLAIIHMANLGIKPGNRDVGNILLKYINSYGELSTLVGYNNSESILKNIADFNQIDDKDIEDTLSETCRLIGSMIYKMAISNSLDYY